MTNRNNRPVYSPDDDPVGDNSYTKIHASDTRLFVYGDGKDALKVPDHMKKLAQEAIKSRLVRVYGKFFIPQAYTVLAEYHFDISDNATPEMLELAVKKYGLKNKMHAVGPGASNMARDAVYKFPDFIGELKALGRIQKHRIAVKFIVDGNELEYRNGKLVDRREGLDSEGTGRKSVRPRRFI